MKKIIIIFAIFLMIAGASVGILKWFNIGPFSEPSSGKVQATKKAKGKIQMLDLDPITVHLVQDDKVISVIKMELRLKTRGADNLGIVTRLKPKLAHAYFSDLHAFIPRMLSAINRLDKKTLRERLVMLSKQVTRTKIIEDVIIKSISDEAPRK
ncbi:MAG: hypothetical protein CMF70_09315 [Magnetovibrio sp.]|nr:hypothetical protein [Magnetovibrio sp.]